jgi:nuclease S1
MQTQECSVLPSALLRMAQSKQLGGVVTKAVWLCRTTLFPLLLAVVALAPSAWGWGCKGHQVIALIAEKNLNPHARAMSKQILAASPISPDLRRFCPDSSIGEFADSSTWADDERIVRPDTAGWHFIDIPRGAPKGDITQYCPPSSGCVTSAIANQLAVLRKPGASAQGRADALRYVIHFVGDLHQPLHAATNDDRGGNCVPVAFFGHAPEETNPVKEDYKPNLHGIWDTDIIEHSAHERMAQQIADELGIKFKAQIPMWESERINLTAWAWETHQVADDVVYGKLPTKVAIETPRPVNTCADDDHISSRMLKLHEQLGDDYQRAAEAVIKEQLTKAGIRLSAVLNALWP